MTKQFLSFFMTCVLCNMASPLSCGRGHFELALLHPYECPLPDAGQLGYLNVTVFDTRNTPLSTQAHKCTVVHEKECTFNSFLGYPQSYGYVSARSITVDVKYNCTGALSHTVSCRRVQAANASNQFDNDDKRCASVSSVCRPDNTTQFALVV
jgi:hypothetical protein